MTEDEIKEALGKVAKETAAWQEAVDRYETRWNGLRDTFGRRMLFNLERRRDRLEHELAKAIYQ